MDVHRRIPIIKLWDLLLVPLQGEVGDDQAERLTADVLGTIHTTDASGLVIDVTGLWLMDSHLCSDLSRLAAASALMGAKTVLCGLSPEIAMTLQTMGLELSGVTTVPTLEEALIRLGIEPAAHEPETSDPTDSVDLESPEPVQDSGDRDA